MTRKSKKGIVGKANPTPSVRYNVGPGLDFVEENLRYGNEIKAAVESIKKDKGLQ